MTPETAKMQYASGATFGSAAYDLGRIENSSSAYEIPWGLPEEQTHEVQHEEDSKESRVNRAKGVGISPFAAIGFGILAIIFVLILMAYVQITEISAQTAEIEASIVAVSQENAALTAEHERKFNLTELEEYAMSELGMVRASDEQELDLDLLDKAVILNQDINDNATDSSGVIGFLKSIPEYLKSK